ncbi:FtsX-like permease family protein [Bacillus sp. AK128]
MTFNHIIWKMAKAHYKKYLFYFLCNSLTVMVFFMFSSIYFNESIVQVKKLDSIKYVLTVPAVSLIVFTVFFIHYSHKIFMKRRKSEFALFMSIGMSGKDIGRLLLVENGIIALLSIGSGLLAGVTFSRLFFLILINTLGLEVVPFHVNSSMFQYTVIIYLIVFLVAVAHSLFLTLTNPTVYSLKSDRMAEEGKFNSPLLGLIGLFILFGSILGLYLTYTGLYGGYFLLLWALLTLLGLFISINQFSSFFIKLAKKYPSFYYRRLFLLTNLDYKFKQFTSIFMLVTVMIMVTILYSTIILFTYLEYEKEVLIANPFDIALIQSEHEQLSKEELFAMVDQRENPVQEHLAIPIYTYIKKLPYNNSDYHNEDRFVFMSSEYFNKLTSRAIELKDTEFLYFINEQRQYVGSTNFSEKLNLPILGEKKTFSLKDIVVGKELNYVGNLREFLIVSPTQFELIKKYIEGTSSTIHLLNVQDWKATMGVVRELEEKLTKPNINDHAEDLSVSSKVEDYQYNKNANGVLFFVTSFISVIFFFGSFILLYLHLFSEVDKEKEKYKKLFKIGMTFKEIKKTVSTEITILFFIPTILGTVLSFLYIVAMATDIGGVIENPQILVHFLIIASMYQCIQFGFFLYAKRKMVLLTAYNGEFRRFSSLS